MKEDFIKLTAAHVLIGRSFRGGDTLQGEYY